MPSSEVLRSFFHRFLEVVSVDAVLLHRAAGAVLAGVAGLLALVAALRRLPVRPLCLQPAAVRADVGVLVGEVLHVLRSPDVVLPFPCLAFLVAHGLDERPHAVVLDAGVVLLAFVSCVRDDVPAGRV